MRIVRFLFGGRMPIVYQTTNLVNEKIYVGVHKGNNKNYLGSGKRLNDAIKHYGKENFRRQTLFECKTHGEAYWIEKFIVNDWFIQQDWNYNLNGGGYGASKIHPNTKKKLSKARKQLYDNPEFKKRVAKATREGQLRSIANGTFNHPKGPKNWNYGIKRSKEFCENLRRVKMKSVVWIKEGKVLKRFDSVVHAAKHFNVHRDTISNNIAKKYNSIFLKELGGHFEYESK